MSNAVLLQTELSQVEKANLLKLGSHLTRNMIIVVIRPLLFHPQPIAQNWTQHCFGSGSIVKPGETSEAIQTSEPDKKNLILH